MATYFDIRSPWTAVSPDLPRLFLFVMKTKRVSNLLRCCRLLWLLKNFFFSYLAPHSSLCLCTMAENTLEKVESGPYFVFSRSTKVIIVVITSITGVLSPLPANIDFPALTAIQEVCMGRIPPNLGKFFWMEIAFRTCIRRRSLWI